MQGTSPIALRLGAASGAAVAALSAAYVVTLVMGLVSLQSPTDQIPDPWFTLMEVLILLIAPCMVALSIALKSWIVAPRRVLASIAVAFFTMCATLTMAVHMVVLVMSRSLLPIDPAIERALFSFQWPSLVYVLDILAWDLAFPLGALATAGAIPRVAAAPGIRWLLFGSSALALAGLIGVPLNDMRLRNIGIVGYALLFPVAAGMMSATFMKALRSPAAWEAASADAGETKLGRVG